MSVEYYFKEKDKLYWKQAQTSRSPGTLDDRADKLHILFFGSSIDIMKKIMYNYIKKDAYYYLNK